MNVITIESKAFEEIMVKLDNLESKFKVLKADAENVLSERWLDNQDLVILLKISIRTLQSYRDEGLISYSQIGNKIYYKASDVDKFLKDNYRKIANR